MCINKNKRNNINSVGNNNNNFNNISNDNNEFGIWRKRFDNQGTTG